MPLFQARELLQFPNGENSTDVLINNVHFNRTALNYWNYTLFSNGTLSNGSNCWLTFNAYTPTMLSNGTFLNGTSCYSPINGIGYRGGIGLGFGAFFAASIMFTLINLRKHGRRFLPNEKRFRVVGRRWQWYWMLFVAACGIISGFTGVDVDRDYLQSTAIILQSFFYYLMFPGLLACVWEGVRHWGSWQERQLCDRDPFSLPQDDVRGKKEFYMPLIFYLFAFLNFFMTIPRSWNPVQLQRSLSQQDQISKPAATDGRFKAGSILAFIAWCLICYDLRHNIHYYKPQSRGPWRSFSNFLHFAPTKFLLTIPLALVRVGYSVASAFEWDISPLKSNVRVGWMYGLGYAPAALIIIIFNIYGYLDPNEDKALIAQRAERGRAVDAELGINRNIQKPSWWSKLHGDLHLDNANAEERLKAMTREIGGTRQEQRLKAMTREIGGGVATQRNLERYIEMGHMPTRRDEFGNPFSDDKEVKKKEGKKEKTEVTSTNLPAAAPSSNASQRTGSTFSASRPPQVVRSMLDI